jgi:hypothetical protein
MATLGMNPNDARTGDAMGTMADDSGAAVGFAALPDGTYLIRHDDNASLITASGARSADTAGPHASFAMVATLAATGTSIEELLRIAGSSIADGPMLAECRVVISGVLNFDVPYRVTRELVSIERKKSRRFGAMDLLRFVARLFEPDGAPVAEVTYTWVLPKRGSAAGVP